MLKALWASLLGLLSEVNSAEVTITESEVTFTGNYWGRSRKTFPLSSFLREVTTLKEKAAEAAGEGRADRAMGFMKIAFRNVAVKLNTKTAKVYELSADGSAVGALLYTINISGGALSRFGDLLRDYQGSLEADHVGSETTQGYLSLLLYGEVNSEESEVPTAAEEVRFTAAEIAAGLELAKESAASFFQTGEDEVSLFTTNESGIPLDFECKGTLTDCMEEGERLVTSGYWPCFCLVNADGRVISCHHVDEYRARLFTSDPDPAEEAAEVITEEAPRFFLQGFSDLCEGEVYTLNSCGISRDLDAMERMARALMADSGEPVWAVRMTADGEGEPASEFARRVKALASFPLDSVVRFTILDGYPEERGVVTYHNLDHGSLEIRPSKHADSLHVVYPERASLIEFQITNRAEVLRIWVRRYLQYRPTCARLSCYRHEYGDGRSGIFSFDTLSAMVAAGLVRRELGGPGTYGHTDLYLTEEGIAEGRRLLDEQEAQAAVKAVAAEVTAAMAAYPPAARELARLESLGLSAAEVAVGMQAAEEAQLAFCFPGEFDPIADSPSAQQALADGSPIFALTIPGKPGMFLCGSLTDIRQIAEDISRGGGGSRYGVVQVTRYGVRLAGWKDLTSFLAEPIAVAEKGRKGGSASSYPTRRGEAFPLPRLNRVHDPVGDPSLLRRLHDGMDSREYRLLSRCLRFFRSASIDRPLEIKLSTFPESKLLYSRLVRKYQKKEGKKG